MKYQRLEVPNTSNQPIYAPIADDEINLVDLLRTLLAHKRLILITLALALFAGGLFSLFAPAKYQTSTRLEIGAYPDISDQEQHGLIESPAAVVAKMKSGYIPRVLHQYEQEHGVTLSEKAIIVSMPKNSNIIVLKSTVNQQNSAMISNIQKLSAQALLDDHNLRTRTLEEELRFKLSKARLELEQLQNEELFQLKLKNELNHIKQEKNNLSNLRDNMKTIKSKTEEIGFQEELLRQQENILEQQLSEVSKLLNNMDLQRENAVKSTTDNNSVMTLMLLDNERRQLYERQSTINSKININLKENARELINKRRLLGLELDRSLRDEKLQADKISQLEGEITKLKYQRNLQIQNQKQNIEAMKARLSGIIPTSIIVGPVQSSISQTNHLLYPLMAVFIGLILSLLLTGLIELMRKVNTHTATPTKSPLATVSNNL